MLRIPIEQLNRSNSHQITISVWFIVVPNCCLYECKMSEINNQLQIHSAARAYRCLCGWFAFDHLPNDHHQSEIIYVFSSKHFWIIQLILICHHSLGHYLSASAFFIAVDKNKNDATTMQENLGWTKIAIHPSMCSSNILQWSSKQT